MSLESITRPLRLYDRTRVTQDWYCPRARYLGYEYAGKGLTPSGFALPLWMGITLHDGLSAIARDHLLPASGTQDPLGIDLIASTAERQMRESLLELAGGESDKVEFAFEQGALVEGILRGFYKAVWPSLLNEYPKILFIEEEMGFQHDALQFMSKPDLVLATDDLSSIIYAEYKSTSSKKEGWVNSWATAVQLYSTIKAIEATHGLKVEKVIVQGLYKGYETYGKQGSPFCYAYKRTGHPPFSHDEVRYDYKPGFQRSPVWEMPGGVAAWVASMPEDTLSDQFPQAPPIFPKEDLVEAFFAQRASREHEIALAVDMLEAHLGNDDVSSAILNTAFPQRFDRCREAWGDGGRGKKCDFIRICHGGLEDPLKEGFTWRTPHHQPEVEKWEREAQEAEAQATSDFRALMGEQERGNEKGV